MHFGVVSRLKVVLILYAPGPTTPVDGRGNDEFILDRPKVAQQLPLRDGGMEYFAGPGPTSSLSPVGFDANEYL